METDFNMLHRGIGQQLLMGGELVEVGEWQSVQDDSHPMARTYEIQDLSFRWDYISLTVEGLQIQVEPNLPWAEDHFQERIGGKPLNPGEQYKNWPWYKQGVEEHKMEGQFSHTYMERYWPPDYMDGVRFDVGNLSNLISMLITRPYTRQAYLPVWFPEDLYAADVLGERVPCSLGYHFLRRGDLLKVVYYMRSCDWFRYFRDDVYLTCRLLQHVAEKVGAPHLRLLMHISSLHVFEPELPRLVMEVEENVNRGS